MNVSRAHVCATSLLARRQNRRITPATSRVTL